MLFWFPLVECTRFDLFVQVWISFSSYNFGVKGRTKLHRPLLQVLKDLQFLVPIGIHRSQERFKACADFFYFSSKLQTLSFLVIGFHICLTKLDLKGFHHLSHFGKAFLIDLESFESSILNLDPYWLFSICCYKYCHHFQVLK